MEIESISTTIKAMKEDRVDTAAGACHWLAMLLDEVANEYTITSKHLQGAIDELYRAKVSEENETVVC